jgi:acyl-CoA reductase-like NAD-dependent aldehyde dehydrogenase
VGCTVVIKPSPFTPLSTLRLVQLMNEVLPPGVVNVVTGGAEVGTHLASHPGVDKIVFTGSIATGKKIMGSASQTVKRITLELGGNDAGVVLPGTDIGPLLEKLSGVAINAGQMRVASACRSTKASTMRWCSDSRTSPPRSRSATDLIRKSHRATLQPHAALTR